MYLIAALVMTLIEAHGLVHVLRVAWRVDAHSASQVSDLRIFQIFPSFTTFSIKRFRQSSSFPFLRFFVNRVLPRANLLGSGPRFVVQESRARCSLLYLCAIWYIVLINTITIRLHRNKLGSIKCATHSHTQPHTDTHHRCNFGRLRRA